jgi:hypothetical protein
MDNIEEIQDIEIMEEKQVEIVKRFGKYRRKIS